MDEDTMDNDFGDELTIDSSTGSLGFQPQKEIFCNKLLPYANIIDAEAQTRFSEIKANLGRAILLREVRFGCSLWTARLCKYIKIYGMKFSKEDHILLVKLMYELITIPNLEPHKVAEFGATLIILLKKKELISPEELELPWKPLYDLTYRIMATGETALGMYRYFSSIESTLDVLVHAAKVYFPVTATQEILDKLRPCLYPLDSSMMATTMETLEWFLPLKLPPKYHSIGHQLWFEEFMSLWEVCHNAPTWEYEIMWLMSRLATSNIGYIDWEPYVPLMFTRFIRYLNLPVTYKHMQSSKHHKMDTSSIAIWIVSVLGHRSCAQDYLTKFLKTIESYIHPANYGQWHSKLRELLSKLPLHFILRLHRERYGKQTWEEPVPESFKLTDEDVDRFVLSIKPLAMTAMFGKMGGIDAGQALQYLATMRPKLIIPDVLERLYSVLDSLTEPHKLTASMNCVVAVARPLVQGLRNYNTGYEYGEGPSQVLPLLFSTLPGIDPNDARKSFLTFRLISVFAGIIPIVDSSRVPDPISEEDRLICESTSRFEDFVLQFLDKVFSLIDSSSLEFVRLESHGGDGKSKLESLFENALAGGCTGLLGQTSDAIFDCALRKLRSLATERILETQVAGRLAAVLCRSFSRGNGQQTLRVLLPPLVRNILDAVGQSDDIAKEENLDNQLLYSMQLLAETLDTRGNYLLPYIDVLIEVLDKTLYLKSREGNQTASRLLKILLLSLSTVTPVDFKSSVGDYNDPEYMSIKDWGQAVDNKDLNVKWYVPGVDEVAAIKKIFSKYLPPVLEKIKRFTGDKNTLTREELLTNLNIMSAILIGCEAFLPVWSEPHIEPVESALEWTSFTPELGIQGELLMPDGSNVRRHIVNIMRDLQSNILRDGEDDIKSLFVVIEIWGSLLLGRMRIGEDHEVRRKNFMIGKKVIEDKLKGKQRHMRTLMVQRAAMQHEIRILESVVCLTETHKSIMLELFILGTSRYGEVRSRAQSRLFTALQYFPCSYELIVPEIVKILGKDSEEHHEAFKGVLYILLGPKQAPIITKRNWILLNTLWPALVLSKPSEKLSVIRLKEKLADTVRKLFPTISIEIEIPSRCIEAAKLLWDNYPKPSLLQPTEIEIEKGVESLKNLGKINVEYYNSLLDKLLKAIIEQSLHWRHRLMAISLIRDLVHPDQIYPAKIVRFFLSSLIHESLEERKIAIKAMLFIFKQQKRKHPKVTIDRSRFENQGECQKLSPGKRPDNAWLQYNYETRPLTSEQWEEQRFMHRAWVGYYTWPKEVKVYAPSSQQPSLDPNIRVLTDEEKEIDIFFNDPSNISKLIGYFSLEERKGKDKFDGYRFVLFKGLFRNHGDVHLKHFLPHLKRLVAEKQESSQRCAAEIVAGLIRGAKHWTFPMTKKMWEDLLPIVRTALSNLTVETVTDWGICFATAQESRDPNRQHWLLECLMEEPPLGESEASFVECGRLYALQGALSQQSWRVSELQNRLLVRLEDRLLANPFQNVRERLGSLLATIFDSDLMFPDACQRTNSPILVQEFMDKVMPRLQMLAQDPATPSIKRAEPTELSSLVNQVNLNELSKDPKNEEREGAARLLKTLCKWLIGSIVRSQYGALPAHYQLFPIVCQLENSEVDEELSRTCTSTLAVLAQAFTLPQHIPTALDTVDKISASTSWWTRATCLEFLQVLIFHNMSILLSNPLWVGQVRRLVLCLLEDERLEVREKAGQVLGGLLHCTFIPDQEILLKDLKIKAKTKLRQKKKQQSNDATTNHDRSAEAASIRVRHAGVLGLCAFINAHPYDVPPFLPSIFEELGPHLNDPQPIPATIRKTLGDFKRTHYDGWSGENGHQQRFTEEQLAVLQDLVVPPTYFA
ncbi:proteasome activator complex subunit 4-like [Neodiprion virginianus]|uniref:proteasome activator complex subunit 4-like n=1 Tax=Neodiprion virginianus TaxID=2961670 RepID=UPI001EE6B279|nr:proteasome activator complex subunit 4-like [Neodiprion virginianus]